MNIYEETMLAAGQEECLTHQLAGLAMREVEDGIELFIRRNDARIQKIQTFNSLLVSYKKTIWGQLHGKVPLGINVIWPCLTQMCADLRESGYDVGSVYGISEETLSLPKFPSPSEF